MPEGSLLSSRCLIPYWSTPAANWICLGNKAVMYKLRGVVNPVQAAQQQEEEVVHHVESFSCNPHDNMQMARAKC